MEDMKDKIKGKGAVGLAIAYFSLRGMVSLPLEPCEYNLLFDDGKKINRVKVISCSYKTPYGIYSASIRTMGGNMEKGTVKSFDQSSCEIVFVATDELDLYSIPSLEIASSRQISLNTYGNFKVKLA
jgi:hypothetical protein